MKDYQYDCRGYLKLLAHGFDIDQSYELLKNWKHEYLRLHYPEYMKNEQTQLKPFEWYGKALLETYPDW